LPLTRQPLLAVLCALGVAWLASRAHAGPPDGEAAQDVWLELSRPADGARQEAALEWLEVAGWAAAEQRIEHDIVIAIDVSGSTGVASGVDIDGDGKVGRARKREDWRSFNPAYLSSDPQDTVLAAELVATHRLVETLDPSRTRIGLVSFHGRASLDAPVGSNPERTQQALARLDGSFGSGATHLAEATDLSVEALLASAAEGVRPRQRSLLILSDGYPTAPGTEKEAAEAALRAAEAAAKAGVRIYCFALGIQEPSDGDVFVQMAARSGGRHVHLQKPGEVIHELPRVNLSRVAEVSIENTSTGRTGRATRLFADGSFDGYVPLAPGENLIRVTARGDRGGRQSVERRVLFEPREARDPAEARAFEAGLERFKRALRDRSVETELAVDANRARETPDPERQLEIRPEEPDADEE
jgi:Mg-chelatase subunit ChlD